MARPRIAPSARSVPISFSVKPHLAEKIEEYSHQLRFSRSKFLAQAVTEAINKIDLKHNLDDLDYRNFTDDRMLMLAKLRLDSAEEINPTVLQQLKDAIESYENRQEPPRIAPTVAPRVVPDLVRDGREYKDVQIIKGTPKGTGGSLYVVHADEQPVAEIEKELNKWLLTDLASGQLVSMHRTLKRAKEQAIMDYE